MLKFEPQSFPMSRVRLVLAMLVLLMWLRGPISGTPLSQKPAIQEVWGDPDTDHDTFTQLMNAALQGNYALVRQLVATGARVNPVPDPEPDTSPLMLACEAGVGDPNDPHQKNRAQYERIVRFLLKHGARVNYRDDDHNTPLLCAAQGGSLKIVRMLLHRGAKVNVRNRDGVTPLMYAAEDNFIAIATLLLRHSARVNVKDNDGSTALMRAAGRSGSLTFVKLLVRHGAKINARNSRGYTPLMAGVLTSPSVVKYLLARGAWVNARTKRGATALMMAPDYNWLPDSWGTIPDPHHQTSLILNLLLRRGAQINVRTSNNTTALVRAVHSGETAAVQLLLSRGADPNIGDKELGTPLSLAVRLNEAKIIALLQKAHARP